MSGSSSRRKGHVFEVYVASFLTAYLDLDVRTGRFFGLTYGADVVTVTGYDAKGRPATFDPDVLGWSVECKAVARRDPAGWLRQADEQKAPGTTPVVLWKRPRKKFEEGSAFLLDESAPRGWVETTIGEWIDRRLTTGEAA
jgi:hypothetical protein